MVNRTERGQIPSYPEDSNEELTTPEVSKTKRVAEDRFSSSECTPVKKLKVSSQRGPFEAGKPPTFPQGELKDSVLGTIMIQNKPVEVRSYESGFLVRQQSLKGCGGACVLMAMLDRNGGSKPVITQEPELFWERIIDGSLLKLDDLLNLLSRAGIPAKERSYYKEYFEENKNGVYINDSKEALNDIGETVRKNGKPMIVGIKHPRLKGHWILIDRVTDKYVHLRDPYTGIAYEQPRLEIEKMILRKIPKEACIALL